MDLIRTRNIPGRQSIGKLQNWKVFTMFRQPWMEVSRLGPEWKWQLGTDRSLPWSRESRCKERAAANGPGASLKKIPTIKKGKVVWKLSSWSENHSPNAGMTLLFLNTWKDLFGKLSYKLLTRPHTTCLTAPFLLIKYIHINMYPPPDGDAVSELEKLPCKLSGDLFIL